MFPEIFDMINNFLTEIDGNLTKSKFLCGDNLTIADFTIGALYTNYVANPHTTFAKDRFAKVLQDFPNFKAYGERFAEANKEYLASRAECGI